MVVHLESGEKVMADSNTHFSSFNDPKKDEKNHWHLKIDNGGEFTEILYAEKEKVEVLEKDMLKALKRKADNFYL